MPDTPSSPMIRRTRQVPLDHDVADFLDDQRWSDHGTVNAISILNRWTRWLAGRGTTVRAAAHRDLEAFLDRRLADGVGQSTRRKDWQMITQFYAWAARPVRPRRREDRRGGGIVKRDPMLGVAGPYVSTKPKTRAAKPAEIETLLDGFGVDIYGRRDAAMVSLMWRSGLRVGELPGIDLADVVEWGSSGRRIIRLDADDTKTNEPRLVPVHPETQLYLDRYLRRRGRLPGPLFLGRPVYTADQDLRMKTKAIADMLKRASAKAGVDVSPHQLRRGFVAQYLRASHGDVLGLEVIGGWADHRMPRRYLADEEAHAGIDRYFDVVDTAPDELAARRRHVTR